MNALHSEIEGKLQTGSIFHETKKENKKGNLFLLMSHLPQRLRVQVRFRGFILSPRPTSFFRLTFFSSFQEYKFSGSRRLLQLGSRCDLGQFIIRQKMRFLVSKITHIIAPGEAAIKVTPSRGPPRGHFGRGKRSNWVRQRGSSNGYLETIH